MKISKQLWHSPVVLICNAVNPLTGRVHDFQWLAEINEQVLNHLQEVILIADDSHGIGIVGKDGCGIFSQIPDLPFINKVVVASMGKALGMSVGMVLGNTQTIQHLRKNIFYSGASPALPAYLYAFSKAQDIYQMQLEKLRTNIAFFIEQITDLHLFDFTTNYPVFRTSKNSLYEKLLENKILISSFPYPKPDSELITRVVLSSLHTKEDLEYLVSKLK
jgi:7-keto-8-aminopelargonate synthetase-like enzyme